LTLHRGSSKFVDTLDLWRILLAATRLFGGASCELVGVLGRRRSGARIVDGCVLAFLFVNFRVPACRMFAVCQDFATREAFGTWL
jgi:hypothetical protein